MDVPKEFEENYEKGIELLEENRFREALPYLANALTYIRDPGLLINFSTALKETGDFQRARELLQEAYEKVPDTEAGVKGMICFNMGNTLKDERKHKESISWYKEAIGLRKGHGGQHFQLGQSYFALRELDKALEQYDFILAHISSKDPDAIRQKEVITHLKSTNIKMKNHNIERKMPSYKWQDPVANNHFREAIKLKLMDAPINQVRAELEEALQREPGNEEPGFWTQICDTYASIAIQQRDIILAQKAVDMGIKALNLINKGKLLDNSNLYMLFSGLTIGYFMTERYQDAEQTCKKALQIVPNSEKMRNILNVIKKALNQDLRKDVKPESTGKEKRCFIATAVYGSAKSPEVLVLKSFRDNILLTSKLGRSIVSFYYHLSPAIADLIHSSKLLRSIIRIIIVQPIVIISKRLIDSKREAGKPYPD